MKIIALAICSRPAGRFTVEEVDVTTIVEEYNLESVFFYYKKDTRKLLQTGIKIVVGKVPLGSMRSLNYESVRHIFHVVVKTDGRSACCVSDLDYPQQAALSICTELLKGDPLSHNLKQEITKYQNPLEADKFFLLIVVYFY
jgi:hypothetical protein